MSESMNRSGILSENAICRRCRMKHGSVAVSFGTIFADPVDQKRSNLQQYCF